MRGLLAVKAKHRSGYKELSNAWIHGSGEFVEQIIKETEGKDRLQMLTKKNQQKIYEFITRIYKNEGV